MEVQCSTDQPSLTACAAWPLFAERAQLTIKDFAQSAHRKGFQSILFFPKLSRLEKAELLFTTSAAPLSNLVLPQWQTLTTRVHFARANAVVDINRDAGFNANRVVIGFALCTAAEVQREERRRASVMSVSRHVLLLHLRRSLQE